MQCQDCKKRIYSPDKIIKYVSIILVNKHINEKSNYDEPYMWLSERINQNKPMYQLYNCPGGHMNKYESEEDALRRELKEETNLNCSNLKLIHVTNTIFTEEDGGSKHYVTLFIKAIIDDDMNCRITCRPNPRKKSTR